MTIDGRLEGNPATKVGTRTHYLHWQKTALNGQDVYIYVHIIYKYIMYILYIFIMYILYIYISFMYRTWWLIPLSCEGEKKHHSKWLLFHTVDGRNPANQLICQISQYLQGVFYCNWCRISSINSTLTKTFGYIPTSHARNRWPTFLSKTEPPFKKSDLAKVLTTDEVTK